MLPTSAFIPSPSLLANVLPQPHIPTSFPGHTRQYHSSATPVEVLLPVSRALVFTWTGLFRSQQPSHTYVCFLLHLRKHGGNFSPPPPTVRRASVWTHSPCLSARPCLPCHSGDTTLLRGEEKYSVLAVLMGLLFLSQECVPRSLFQGEEKEGVSIVFQGVLMSMRHCVHIVRRQEF